MDPKKEKEILEKLEKRFENFPDFPKKGILFRDITPIFGNKELYSSMVDVICNRVAKLNCDFVLGIESRGFLVCPLIAIKLGLPFGPIRKKGKLPGNVYSASYELEYGSDTLEVKKNMLPAGSRCLVVDDLIATGGSLEAAKKLVELSGSKVAGIAVIIELKALKGREKLGDIPMISLFQY